MLNNSRVQVHFRYCATKLLTKTFLAYSRYKKNASSCSERRRSVHFGIYVFFVTYDLIPMDMQK